MISTIVLLVGLGLGVLWIIALAVSGTAAAWFTWLVFVAAVVLVIAGALGLRRRV
jgi:hypothetical protein